MAITPRVFISHSAANDPVAKQLVDQLTARLRKGKAFEVDQSLELQPGTEWRPEVYTWLRSCHAAVVILSQKVLDHPGWVSHETSVLRARTYWEPDFKLIPVLLPPVTREALEKNQLFSPLAIPALQAAKANTVPDILAKLWKALSPLRTKPAELETGMGRIERDITERLDALPRQTLDYAAAALKNGKLAGCGSTGQSCGAVLARKLLESDYQSAMEAVLRLAKSGGSGRAVAGAIITYLAPCWVSPLTAEQLPHIARQAETQRAIAIAGDEDLDDFTPYMFIQRAVADTGSWPIAAPLNKANEHDTAWLTAQIMEQFATILTTNPAYATTKPKEVALQIRLRDKVSPQIVILHGDVPVATLKSLRQNPNFGTVTFISYFDHVPAVAELQERELKLVQPTWSEGEDRTNHELYTKAYLAAVKGLT